MIVMRWCSGYLDNDSLEKQLSVWQNWLYVRDDFCLGDEIESAIVIMDNRVDEEKDEYECTGTYEGQQVRCESNLQNIFKRAGLRLYKHSEAEKLEDNGEKNMIWVLY